MGTGQPPMIRVILYSRPGCHLCEIMERVIRHVQSRRGFELIHKNIDDDLGDFEKYRHEIPVVSVNGIEVARHELTAAALEAALDAAEGKLAQ